MCDAVSGWQVTLSTNLNMPFLREFWLSLGICSADRKTFHNILAQPGRAIAVVVGGAAESLKASPGTLDLYLAHRKGFVRQVCVLPESGMAARRSCVNLRTRFARRFLPRNRGALTVR
jgi:hypothetical protein